jgi:hypothetical protein
LTKVGGDLGIALRKLQRRHVDAIAVRDRRLLDRTPLLRDREITRGFARETAVGDFAKTEAVIDVVHVLAGHRQCDLGGAHVARMGDHAGDIEHALVVHVADRVPVQGERAGRSIDRRVRLPFAAFQRRGNRERLHRRTGLDDVGDGAVALVGRVDVAARIRIERWLVDHREDLSGRHVEDHHRTRRRVMLLQRSLQFAVGEILDAAID